MTNLNTLSGFTLPEGTTITDLDHWPEFAEWAEQQGFEVDPHDGHIVEMFEAWLEGGYRQFSRE